MSLIVLAVCAAAASAGYLAARWRRAPAGEGAAPRRAPEAGDPAGETGAASKPARPPSKTKPAASVPAPSPFDGLPLSLGDVVSAEREERWLAGAIVARDGGRTLAVLFLAPEGARVAAVAAFPAPRREIQWLEPVEVVTPAEPPATLEIRGATLTRKGRIPVTLERHGQGAPPLDETGLWAAYEGAGRDVAVVIACGAKVHAWAGVRFEPGEYDRLGGGGD